MIVPGQMNVSATGAFTYTIPVAVPPGTAGMVPALSLDYSSQNGDGIVGLGWTLSGLPSITRCPRTLAQDNVHGGVNYDTNDRFCMEGQRLVAISGTYGASGTEYRTELDGFSKIISYGAAGNGPAYFKVWTKSGQIMEFGNTTDSRLLAVGKTTARAWAANKISDTKGNYLTVTYNNDETNGQAYPTRIDYTGNASAGLATYNSVQFSYTTRGDIVPTYQAGSLQQTTVILTDIKTYTGSTLVSDYRLAYRAGTTILHSRLTSVTLCDGSGNCLAPTTFGWQGGAGLPAMSSTPQSSTQGNRYFFSGDFNADGLIDYVVPSTTANNTVGTLYSGTLSGFTSGTAISVAPQFSQAANPYNYFSLDLNGDGASDLFWAGTVHYGTYVFTQNSVLLNSGSGQFTQTNNLLWNYTLGDFNGDGRSDYFVQLQSSYPELGNGDGTFTAGSTYSGLWYGSLVYADFDGDGCTDVLDIYTTSTITYFCNPASALVTLPSLTGGEVVVGDFNGDGKADILVAKASSTGTLYLSTGTGLVAQTSFTVPSGWGKFAIYTGDFNGDGKTDLLLVAPGNPGYYGVGTAHQIWLSTGTGFVEATTIANNNALDGGSNSAPYVTANVVDWNSDGATDIWLQKPSGDTEYTFSFVPELMTTVSNGIGSTITVAYDRLNKNNPLYTKCPNNPSSYACGDAYPTKAVDGAIYVVSRIDSSNGVGGTYSSTYAYGGAKTDLKGRGFLGFAQVAVTDLQTNVVQTTNYHTDFPYVGLIASQTKTHSATTLSSVTNTYADTSEGTGTDGVARHFVSLTQSVASGNDLDGSTLPTTTTSYTYDGYGNALTVSVSVSDGSSKVTTNTYSNDTTNWFLGRLLTTSVQSIVGSSNLTRHSSFVYDATSGLLTQEIVEPSSTNNLYLSTTYTYDVYGNRVSATTSTYSNAYGAARTTTASFDSKGEFKTGDCNALSQCETWAYDARFGEATSHTGPNGLTTTWSYDGFGRVTLETKADGTKTVTAYAYCSGVNGGTASCPTNGAYLATATPENSAGAQNGPVSQPYYDALSRAIAGDVQGFDGSWIRVSTIYDSNGRVGQTSRPYFVSGGTAKWTVNTYDDLGRVTQATMPDGSHITYAFHGLTTSVTNNLGQTTTTVKNAQGLNASVTDSAGKTTSYVYEAEGDLAQVTDPSGNVTTNTYDVRGRKTASSDPDMGSWSYTYDGFGELVSQTDAKSQTSTLAYDALGRVTSRTEPGLTSTWTYDTATHGIGQLAGTSTNAGYSRSQTYDPYGRPASVSITVSGTPYTYTATYNSDGRVDTVTYPSGLVLKYVYVGTYGYLSQVKDNATGTAYWTANTRDAEMHLTAQTFGNAVQETQSFDPNTGLVQQILAGVVNSVANFHYSFDTIGNLTQRQDTIEGYTENFCYDNLNRLVNYALGASCTASGYSTVAYDALGNITSKTGVGTYSYPAAGQARPHAVSSITGTVNGVVNPTYTYDADGNMTAGAGRTVTWTSFNMVAQITQGTTTVAFAYDSDHHRITQTIGGSSPSTTTYLNALGAMSEKYVVGSTTTWRDYIQADGHIIAEKFSGGTTAMRYFVLDHLGSVAVVMDDAGTVLERLSYDAWGQRRCSNGTGDASCFTGSSTTRGFTNQEEMDEVGLVNLNARLYDPVTGRFMSADPTVEAPFIPQDLNRYSYVGNNPLSFTDPTGYGFLDIFAAIVAVAIIVYAPELLGALETTAFSASALGSFVNIAIAGTLAGGVSAGLTGGNILQGALLGGMEAAFFAGLVPSLGSDINAALDAAKSAPFVGKMIASGLVGGMFSLSTGGNFGSGFLAAGVGSLGGGLGGTQFNFGKMLVGAALGGAASVLGGGKFANGAITAAFAYAASTLSAPERQSVGGSGSDPKVPTLTKQLLPYLSREGNTLYGVVETQCNAGIECVYVTDELNKSYNHAYYNGYSFMIDFVQVVGRSTPELSVEEDNFNACGNSADAYACAQNGHIYLTHSYKYQPNIISHEFGHILGFGDSSNPESLMYYTIPHPAYLPGSDARRLIDGYPN